MTAFRNSGRWALLLAVPLGLLATTVVAQNHKPDPQAVAAPNAPEQPKAGGEGEAAKKPKRFGDIAEVTKDMQTLDGLFTLFRFDPSDKDRDPEKLLCKIPKALLNEDLLLATSIAAGGPMTGYQWADWLVRWEVVGTNLKLVTPDYSYQASEDKTVGDVIKRTYNERYLAAVPILAMTPGGDPVIDFGQLLKSNLAEVQSLGGAVRPDLSTWAKVKVFPDNVLIEADLALGGGAGGRSVGIAYSFQRLPKVGTYKPRLGDERLGFFMTERVDWGKPSESRENIDRYINRWNLEKKDPSLDLSPPKKPITFYIEKTVPVQWRRWVRAGIEEWNRAYEKIGFVDAVVVQQQTDDNEFKDLDPEDSRYNFFRWIVSGRAFAMGPSRADPRTGQIMDADIIMDDSFIRAWMHSLDTLVPAKIADIPDTSLKQFGVDYPELLPLLTARRSLDSLRMEGTREQDREQWAAVDAKMREFGREHMNCAHAEGMMQQLAVMQLAMLATSAGKKIPENLLGEAIKEVVAHEVGHTLGLRHNFKGSSWLTMEEARKRRDTTDEPTTGSVMDYNPLLFFADDEPEKVRHFITPCIGPYDYLVIEYGYRVPGKGDKAEDEMLKEIAAKTAQPGNHYATDEDTTGIYSPDPLVNRYDFSSDPIAYAKSRLELADKLIANVGDWSIKDGEPRYFVTRSFNTLFNEKGRNFSYVSRIVGGQYHNRDRRGDPDARLPLVLVDPDMQRNAMKLLGETLLKDDFYRYSPEILNTLAASRWEGSMRVDYPIHDRILNMQVASLYQMVSPVTLQRVYDAELKSSSANKFTAAELLTTTRDLVWPQIEKVADKNYTDAQPFISSIGRNLQVEYLNWMLAQANTSPGSNQSPDLTGMVRFTLRELSDKIGDVMKKSGGNGKSRLDFASRAHLSEAKSRIDRVLDAQYMAR